MRKLVFAGLSRSRVLLSVLFLSVVILTGSSAQDANIVADVNGDGVVNQLDLQFIVMHFGDTVIPAQVPHPDVNGDGIVNILDVVFVANHIQPTGTGGTLIFGRGNDSITLDPGQFVDGESAKVCDALYDTLVQYRSGTTELEPALAEAWDSSADGLTWTFYLRQGVQFHDGTPFDAAAVVFSFTRPRHPSQTFNEEFIEQVTALDAFTVQFQLKKPYAPFISTMAATGHSLVSPTAAEKFGVDFTNNPVGTGPFKFVQWDAHDKIVLEANAAYWAGKPPIDRLIFRAIRDNAMRLSELLNGAIHVMEFPNPDDIPLIQGDATLELLMQPGLNGGYIGMNMDKPPFDNLKVRLAINHAINKPAIIEQLYQGFGILSKGPLPPTLWGYDDAAEDYAYDVELARRLLAEAGYPDGFETTLWALPVPRPYIPDGHALAEAIQADLRHIGIEAEIVTFDWGTYIDKVLDGQHDMALLGWIAEVADPDGFFSALLTSMAAEKPAFNIAFYRSEEMDAVIEQAKISTDIEERIALYHQAQAIFHKDAPWVPLAHAQRLLVINKKVKNLVLPPLGWNYLHTVSLESE